ncbi:hypothetical protein [Sediminibacterium sp. C3]|uniref:hypothetical protein n=1 Tax=Sediminibacterium sp. C3 TaxID=1267211 RepID=UPI00040C04F4|nr:hypothetical protein [Sediminibacterium sp. C3]
MKNTIRRAKARLLNSKRTANSFMTFSKRQIGKFERRAKISFKKNFKISEEEML